MASKILSPVDDLDGQIVTTVKGACAALRTSRSTIRRLCESGQLKPIKIGGAVRFSVVELRKLMGGV